MLPAAALAALLLGAAPASAQQPIGTVRVADGLFRPTFVIAPPEDFSRLFILQKGGDVFVMDLVTGTIKATPFLTVSAVAEGLQGLAFHPSYGSNGYVYVHYYNSSSRSVVERFTRDPADPDLTDPASARKIIEIPQPYSNHNGGWIGFGPDGYLYYPMGDGGSSCDPLEHGQNTDTLLGSLLRLDVDGDDFPADPDRNYAIPPDNPFVGLPGADEVWAYGLRNPFRSSFDRLTGDLYIADVGQATWEEINLQPAFVGGGENYGWDLREGFLATPDVGSCAGGPPPPGNVDPIYAYAHGSGDSQGNAVTGGYVYRGPGAELEGRYFFGDYVNERIWSFDAADGDRFTDWTATFDPAPADQKISDIVSFGEDGAGYLYIVDLGADADDPGGEVYRVVGPFPFVPCPDLALAGEVVTGPELVEHCRNVAAGPAYTVDDGGDLTIRAGNRVGLLDGFAVAAGGSLAVENDDSLRLTPP